MSEHSLPARIVHRLSVDPAPLIAAAAVLAIGVVLKDRRLARGGGRMLTLEVGRRVAEGVMRGSDDTDVAAGAAAVIPAAAAWAAGMVADRLFGADPVETTVAA